MDVSEGDDCNIGMRQALPVPPLPIDFDPSVPPTSGEEYLQHVMYEAKNCDSVAIAKDQTWNDKEDSCDPALLGVKAGISNKKISPPADWEANQLQMFATIRDKMRERQMSNEKQEILTPDVDGPVELWVNFIGKNKPLVSLVLSLGQGQLERILRALLNMITSSSVYLLDLGAWFYAVCACLESPLSREACGDLRDIARACAQKEDPDDREIVVVNLIIAIVVKYFGQVDLFEPT